LIQAFAIYNITLDFFIPIKLIGKKYKYMILLYKKMNHNSRHKNIFKKKQQQNNNLKTNGRWKNFQKTVETEKTNTFQNKRSRFDNFDSTNKNERSSRFGQRQHSKFGKKRFYKSRYKKEETLDYFKTNKNATQRNVSLFDFAKKTIEKK
jgi:hypothetical protein